ncbi:MAG: hypothetical protein ACOY0T_10160 [Myxococcota bacterium]
MTRKLLLAGGEPVLIVMILCSVVLGVSAFDSRRTSSNRTPGSQESLAPISNDANLGIAAERAERDFNEGLALCAAGDQGACSKLDALQQRLARLRERDAESSNVAGTRQGANATGASM